MSRNQPAPAPVIGLAAGAQEVRDLLAKGDSKQALQRAKEVCKGLSTPAAEALVVEAYLARIQALSDRGLTIEAEALIRFVCKQYPASRAILQSAVAIPDDPLESLVRPLNDPATPSERREAIEKTIQREITDLAALAQCDALPPDHPLRKAAAALDRAFAQATRGPVRDEEIALREVSHRSPLAPWKMIIRAIALFYRRDDEGCWRCLDVIDSKSAPARLSSALRALLAGKGGKELKPATASLVTGIGGNPEALRDSLRTLDTALERGKPSKIVRAIERVTEQCQEHCPDLLVSLRQQISVRSVRADVPVEQVRRAMGEPSLKDARFWRLFARAMELEGDLFLAASLWEEFRSHAVHEGWCSPDGPEVASLYLHMADLVRQMPHAGFDDLRERFSTEFKGYAGYYQDQPPQVRAAASPEKIDLYFLHPESLYAKACAIDPDPEIFKKWLAWVEEREGPGKGAAEVALRWHEARPQDSRPLLLLMHSAEKRNALKKALQYLEMAERVDGLNPEVRGARLRLLVASALRHLKGRKPHLAEKELAAIESLPQAREGRRPAFVAALRSRCAMDGGRTEEASQWREEACRRMESDAGAICLLWGVAEACGVRGAAPAVAQGKIAEGTARACALGIDMGVPFGIPGEWEAPLLKELSRQECALDSPSLRALAEAALRAQRPKLAYAVSGAGMAQGGPALARFLLLRGKCLPYFERRSDCLIAATELARRQRDMDLADEAVEALRQGSDILDSPKVSMESERVEQVIEREKNEREFPPAGAGMGAALGRCDCAVCRSRRRGGRDPIEDLDESLPGKILPGLPPEITPLLMEMIFKYGGPDGSLPDPRVMEKLDLRLLRQIEKIMLKSEFGRSL